MASTQFPVPLLNLTKLNFGVDWTMAPSDGSSSLSAIQASADVVIDMFLDPSWVTAMSSTTKPKYEVMVWMGQYGYANAIGANLTKTPPTYKLNGTTLYAIPTISYICAYANISAVPSTQVPTAPARQSSPGSPQTTSRVSTTTSPPSSTTSSIITSCPLLPTSVLYNSERRHSTLRQTSHFPPRTSVSISRRA